MARSRRRPATPQEEDAPAAQEEAGQDEQQDEQEDSAMEEGDELRTQPLRFNEPLSWKSGKPISVTELLRRLQALAEETGTIDQGYADRKSVLPVAQELANKNLLLHKDKGVVAWTLVCIVDMFRVLAPDAPYKGGQLHMIFDIFASVLIPALASPSDPYNAQHTTVLSSLTQYRSIVLMTDIPGADELILKVFTNTFDVAAGTIRTSHGETLPKNVVYHLTNLLHFIIEECEGGLPDNVLSVILAQFLRVDPRAGGGNGKKGESNPVTELREIPLAYKIAQSICNQSESKMSREVGQYFGTVLVEASESMPASKPSKSKGKKRGQPDDEDAIATPPPEIEMDEMERVHRLLRELWRTCPGVVLTVIPAIVMEIRAEDYKLRRLAVETIGDMIAGIGSAGPPPATPLDSAAYPPQRLDDEVKPQSRNILLQPRAPRAFSETYPTEYNTFVAHSADSTPGVRIAWIAAAGLIISTAAGGKGMSEDAENELLRRFTDGLIDTDGGVRLATINAIAKFDFRTIIDKLCKRGGINGDSTPLFYLGQRMRDQQSDTKIVPAAVDLLARLWGVASGEIAEGNERIRDLLGGIPSAIYDALRRVGRALMAPVHRCLYEALVPVYWPPKRYHARDGTVVDLDEASRDKIRTERILLLFQSFRATGDTTFMKLMSNRKGFANIMQAFLGGSESIYISGKDDKGKKLDKQGRANLEKHVAIYAQSLVANLPDAEAAKAHLLEFGKSADTRAFQLVRFCYDPTSDYGKIQKSMRELTQRLKDNGAKTAAMLESLTPLLWHCSLLIYNRSHVPTIVEFSRTDEKGLGAAAHDALKTISTEEPAVFKAHVTDLCASLRKQAPNGPMATDTGAADTLKACSGFARRFPDDVGNDRNLAKALVAYAKYGNPPKAAKYAVSILLIVTRGQKEMYIKELLEYCVNKFAPGEDGNLAKLATLAQLELTANADVEERQDEILDIAASKTLMSDPEPLPGDEDEGWRQDIDDTLMSKLLALKVLVNTLRGSKTDYDPQEVVLDIKDKAMRVYRLLNTLIKDEGGLVKTPAPAHEKSRMRLAAGVQLLKLSCNKIFDTFLLAHDFNELSKLCQDIQAEVRHNFFTRLIKYLDTGRLAGRFLALMFLSAFEPDEAMKSSNMNWIQAHAIRAASASQNESTGFTHAFPRLISLLAHHQDFTFAFKNDRGEEEEIDEEQKERNTTEFDELVEYLTFYLRTVASAQNVSLLFHVAQRLKTVEDGIDPSRSDNLYALSEIAQETVRQFADAKKWYLPTYTGTERLPVKIFAKLSDRTSAKTIAETQYVPTKYLETVDELVKAQLRPKKRKAEKTAERSSKKAKSSSDEPAKKKKKAKRSSTPKPKKPKKETIEIPLSERRKSGRAASNVNYAETDEAEDQDEDVVEVEDVENEVNGDESREDEQDEDMDVEEEQPSTPPTSSRISRAGSAKKPVSAKSDTKRAASRKGQMPVRGSKGKSKAKKKDKDIMDFPSDDEEMGDA